MFEKYEKFYGKVTKVGNSLCVIIPANLKKYAGIDEGEEVECYIRLKPEEEE